MIDTKKMAIGFVAGFAAVLVFHQLTVGLLHLVGVIANPPYRTNATGPLGVPQFINAAFWGGVWGIVIAHVTERFATRNERIKWAAIIGAVGATLVGWFIVAPIKGNPVAGGWNLARIWIGPVLNGMFGLGTGIFLELIRERLAHRTTSGV
jgi:hypothetical protein